MLLKKISIAIRMRNETDSVTITLMNYFVRDIADKTKPAETIAGKTRTRWNINTGWDAIERLRKTQSKTCEKSKEIQRV